jgi:hypothetical protein
MEFRKLIAGERKMIALVAHDNKRSDLLSCSLLHLRPENLSSVCPTMPYSERKIQSDSY